MSTARNPPGSTPVMDRRAVRTRAALRRALVGELRNAPMSRISVSSVAAAADVTRRTFYQHYQSVDEVLADTVDGLMEKNFAALRDEDLRLPMLGPALLRWSLASWLDQQDTVRALVGNGISPVMFERLEVHAETLIRRVAAVNGLRIRNEAELAYCVSSFTGAAVGVMSRWVRSGFNDDMKQLIDLGVPLVMPLLAGVFAH